MSELNTKALSANDASESTTASFRFLRLDRMQAYTLRREIAGASFYESTDTGDFVGLVPLKEPVFDALNDYLIRQQISYDACDLFVQAKLASAGAGSGSRTLCKSEHRPEVSIPREVNKILKYIDCKITVAVE